MKTKFRFRHFAQCGLLLALLGGCATAPDKPVVGVRSSEIADASRLVRLSDQFAIVTAFAGRFPYETWLLPRRHDLTFDDVDKLSVELHWLLNRVDVVLDQPAYNLVLHAAPAPWGGAPAP